MSRDQMYGGLILAGSIIGILLYIWLVIYYAILILQITAVVAVVSILGILGWIGYTLATTPPPPPIEPESSPAPSGSEQEKKTSPN